MASTLCTSLLRWFMEKSVRGAVLRRIQKVGFLTDIEATVAPSRPELKVDWSPNTWAFPWGETTGFILELCLTADRWTRITRFGEMEIAGQEMHVDWRQNRPGERYQFGGSRGQIYPWDIVLNHRVDELGIVEPGTPVEGILLGTCAKPFPPACRRARTPARLFIEDGFGTVHVAEISVQFDESLRIEIPKPRRSSLFEVGETIPDWCQAALQGSVNVRSSRTTVDHRRKERDPKGAETDDSGASDLRQSGSSANP
jgi:hypothetical protein